MQKLKRRLILSTVAFGCSILCASAVPITGEISFDGTIVFNTTDLGSATTINQFVNERVSVGTQMGSYAGVPNDALVTFAEPIDFTAFSGPLNSLWAFNTGGSSYSFDLNTLAVVFRNSSFLALEGNGIAHITGLTDTPGVWRLTAQEGNQRFSFSASSAFPSASVPDGGSTVLLLGAALTAIGAVRRKCK